MIDRYTKTVLTVIAGALIYLCVTMTAFPAVSAQGTQRPGMPSGPLEVVVVGWRPTGPIAIASQEPLRVITERTTGAADRVVVVGWEEGGQRGGPGQYRPFTQRDPGVPVSMR